MTEAQRAERGRRAKAAYDEFVAPIMDEVRSAYSARIVEIASTELGRDKRTDKITALSTALRVLASVDAGLQGVIVDGELAQQSRLDAAKMELLSPAKRRFLDMVPH